MSYEQLTSRRRRLKARAKDIVNAFTGCKKSLLTVNRSAFLPQIATCNYISNYIETQVLDQIDSIEIKGKRTIYLYGDRSSVPESLNWIEELEEYFEAHTLPFVTATARNINESCSKDVAKITFKKKTLEANIN